MLSIFVHLLLLWLDSGGGVMGRGYVSTVIHVPWHEYGGQKKMSGFGPNLIPYLK